MNMNLYWLDAGEQHDTISIDYELGGPEETYQAIQLIAAPTRGKAKSFMLGLHSKLDWIEPMRILLIEKDIDLPEGEVDNPILWLQAWLMADGDNQPEEWYSWQMMYENGELAEVNDEH